MAPEPDSLPDDVALLRRLVREQRARLAAQDEALTAARAELEAKEAELADHIAEIERLKLQPARLRRMRFGRSSEKLDRAIEQLELVPEDLEEAAAARKAGTAGRRIEDATEPPKRGRRALPGHLPREEVVDAAACTCPRCGGGLRKLGEDVPETLEYVPASFKVIRHIRPHILRHRSPASGRRRAAWPPSDPPRGPASAKRTASPR